MYIYIYAYVYIHMYIYIYVCIYVYTSNPFNVPKSSQVLTTFLTRKFCRVFSNLL